jgi:hypothetical protein
MQKPKLSSFPDAGDGGDEALLATLHPLPETPPIDLSAENIDFYNRAREAIERLKQEAGSEPIADKK